jgi:hypothetical protein
MKQDITRWSHLGPEELAQEINHLILHDFPSLVQILYRMDVSEEKLKNVLAGHPQEDAGKLIAALIIERLKIREEMKQHFPRQENIPDEDRW